MASSSSVPEAVVALTVDTVHQVIDRVIVGQASASSHPWRRIVDWTAVNTTKSTFSNGASLITNPKTATTTITTAPFFFGIYRQAPLQSLLQTDAADETTTHFSKPNNDCDTVAICTFYLAYSTWDGRMFNVDRLVGMETGRNGGSSSSSSSSSKNDDIEALYRILAQMAVALNCTRLTWKVRPMQGSHPLTQP